MPSERVYLTSWRNNLIIKKIRIKNFLPFFGEQEIVLPQEPEANITIFFGENTKGKTSVLNAFKWVLYEKAESKGIVILPQDLLNKKAKDNGQNNFSVELSFSDSDNEYVLYRECVLGDSPTISSAMKVNGDPVTRDEQLSTIQRIVPSDTARFFLFDGEVLQEYQNLLDVDSKTAKRISNAIEDVLGVPALTAVARELPLVVRTLRERTHKELVSSTAHDSVNAELAENTSALEVKRSELVKIKDRISVDKADLEDIETFLAANEKNKGLLDLRKGIEFKIDAEQTHLGDFKEDVKSSREDVWQAILYTTVVDMADSERANQESIEEKQNRLIKIMQTLSGLQSIDNTGFCPLCAQRHALTEDQQKELTELEEEKQIIDTALRDSEVNSSWTEVERSFRNTLKLSDIIARENKMFGSEITVQGWLQEIKIINTDLGEFTGEDVLFQQQKKFGLLRQSLGEGFECARETQEQINGLESSIQILEATLAKFATGDIAELQKKLSKAISMQKLFDDALAKLRENLRKTVEKRATEAFQAMTSRPEDYARLEITDSYGLHIIDHDGRVVPTRSSGAEQVVALALINGLNRTGKRPGPVIMDTPLGRLDKTHRKNILDFMPKTATQLILFVHSGELEEGDEIIKFLGSRIGRQYGIRSIDSQHSELEVR
jgi:DNA sulfur modification protein DndD